MRQTSLRRRRVVLVGLACCAGILSVLASIDTAAQQGASPVRRTARGRVVDLESQLIRVPLASADKAYARIEGARIKQWVEELAAISRKARDDGERYWGRIAGARHEAAVHQWSEEKVRAFGLEKVRTQEISLRPQWFPTSWSVTATGSGTTLKPTSVFPARGSAATPAAGLDLEAVWVGLGTEADFAGRDVKGKLAVMHSWPTDAPHAHSAAWLGSLRRAADKGAAAVLVNRATPGNFQLIGHNSPVPTLWIGTEDGNALRDLIAKGPVKVNVQLQTEMRQGLKDANVWGSLPGTTDEEIFVKAHHDGYFEAAMDNGSGVATMMAIAEYFAKVPKAQRRRTLTFVSVAAHHGGGDREWMNDPLHPVGPNAALMINCEHTAVVSTMTFGDRLRKSTSIDPRRWTVIGSDRLAALTVEAFTRYGVTLYEETEGSGDDDGPAPAAAAAAAAARPSRPDMPFINLIHSPQRFYHNDNDRPEFIPASGLEAATRAFVRIIDEANKLEIRELRRGTATTTASAGAR
jgi:hypothetical protein